MDKRFYENPLFVWALLFIFPPLGIITLWIVNYYHLYMRITISFLFTLLFLNHLGLEASFIRATLLVLLAVLLYLRNIDINKHKTIALTKLDELLENLIVQEYIKKFLFRYENPLSSYTDIKLFEELLEKGNPILTTKFMLGNLCDLYVNTIYKPLSDLKEKIEPNDAKMTTYKTNFDLMYKVLSKTIACDSDKVGRYFLWVILKRVAIDYFADKFIEKYGEVFNNIDIKSVIDVYISNDSLNKDKNSEDRTLLTYYLMKNGQYSEYDFVESSNLVENEIQKQIKIKKEKDFELSLKSK